MKLRLVFLLLLFSGFYGLQAQEFETWNAADFDISIRQINPALEDFDFGFSKSKFDLPDGSFLNVDDYRQNGVNIVALIEEKNNYRERTVDIGSPLPQREKKDVEFSVQNTLRERGVENEALNSNPYYQNQRIYQNALHNSNLGSMYGRRYYYSPYGRYY